MAVVKNLEKLAADVVSGIDVPLVKRRHFSCKLYGFFNGSHEDIGKEWPEWRTHGDAIGLFVNLAIELKQLIFGGCSEKIYKVHSAKVQLVGFVEPVICESFISKYLYGFP